MIPAGLTALLALPAAAQPVANPASFGTKFGAVTVGVVLAVLVFLPFKTKGFELRWRRNRPALGRAVVALGACAAMAVFYIVVFKL